MKHSLFLLGFGCLITHELDAVLNHEWRVLPLLRSLPDELGTIVFVAVHIPIVAVVVALISSIRERTRVLSLVTSILPWLVTNARKRLKKFLDSSLDRLPAIWL